MATGAARAMFVALSIVAGCKRAGSPPIAPASAVAGASTDGPQAVVTASRGKVELLRSTSTAWSAVKVGDHLGARDALRTDLGEADLAVEGIRMRLHDASRLDLRSVDKRSMRTRVHGSVESEVDEAGKLDVEIGDGDATAHSEGGHFFVTADGRGVIAVAAVTGSVHLSSRGKAVEVAKGEVSRIDEKDGGPSPPSAALRRVLLAVQWPGMKETNQPTVPIAGRVEPGSRVFVQGQPVTVEPGGQFRAEVPLKQGKQKIAIVTVDAMGRRKQVESVVKRDDSLPAVKVKKKLWQWHR
jgi:glucodextranase-like protein